MGLEEGDAHPPGPPGDGQDEPGSGHHGEGLSSVPEPGPDEGRFLARRHGLRVRGR